MHRMSQVNGRYDQQSVLIGKKVLAGLSMQCLRLHPAAMAGGKPSQAAPNMKVAVRQPKKKDRGN